MSVYSQCESCGSMNLDENCGSSTISKIFTPITSHMLTKTKQQKKKIEIKVGKYGGYTVVPLLLATPNRSHPL